MSTNPRVLLCYSLLLAALLAWSPFNAAAYVEDETPVPAEFHQTLELPLTNGKLQLSELLVILFDRVGMDGKMLTGFLDTSIDVTGTTGRLTMKTIAFATRGIITIDIQKESGREQLILRVDRLALREKRSQIQGRLIRLIEAWEPKAAEKLRGNLGWFIHQPTGKPIALAEGKLADGARVVVLIHGLDEPGWCWDTIGPALVKEGYTVCELRYPNDQSIPKSTQFLAKQLAVLRVAGAKDVAILAHSMGALIARDVLTHRDHYAGKGAGSETYPTITRLIMLGPPNHGSVLAEMQIAGEVREQVIRLFTGDGHLFGAFFDGAGEAKEDLLPGSPFLKDLNARPLPEGVKLTILASQMSPVTAKQIEAMRAKLRDEVPAAVAWGPDQIAAAAAKMADGLGDGAVPVSSTKLDGVTDYVMVPGNHSSMLHKKDGEVTALKEILKRLKN